MNEEIQIAGHTANANQTIVHPLGLLAVVVLGLCILLVPRRWSVIPLLVMACFVPSAQRIVIATLDFSFLRIMVLFGVMRLILHKEYLSFIWRPLDTAMVMWTISAMLFYTMRESSFGAFVNRLGFGFDALGMYFLFRCLIKDWTDVDHIVLGYIWIGVIISIFFLLENRTRRNVFSIFGGVPPITSIRQGRLRCQGAFSHPILAGCFWASLMPLMAAYWWKSIKDKSLAITGLIASLIIVICCASSTPVVGVISGLIGGGAFFFRRSMRPIRWGVFLTLFALHLIMDKPVWHLICRFSAVGGSTGWHRYKLLNGAITHFKDWWFWGCSGQRVYSWGVHAGDITNQYVLEGVRGGFFTLCLFVAVLVYAFKDVGKLWRHQTHNPYRLALAWALGVSLFVHCMNYIGVSYFGQMHILWYLLLAIIGSLTAKTEYSKRGSSKEEYSHPIKLICL